MTSGPEVRIEARKVDLITQLLTAALSIFRDAIDASQPVLEPPIKHPRSKRQREASTRSANKNGEYDGYGGTVIPIGPLLRSPIEPEKKYDLKFAAKYLDIGAQTIRRRIKEETLIAERKGNGRRSAWFITGEELIRFSNSLTTGEDQ